jgi:glycosyltransferase involved in cell wall biosynthesis
MARAILRLLQDKGLAARLAANAQVNARERFDVDRTAAEYAALYRQVLGR